MTAQGEGADEDNVPGPRPAFDFDRVQALVQRHFKVYEVERDIRGVPGAEIAAFYVQADSDSFHERFEALRRELRAQEPELLMILQHKMGEDLILVARKPRVRERGIGLNIVLLVLTVLTTTLAGAIFYQGYERSEDLVRLGGVDASFLHPRLLGLGFLTFSLPLIFILGIHELGHYFVAKRHSVRTSLPFFIPVPPIVPIGTFGAFISIREPIPDRKALFDIGAAGPLIGFVAAIPILVLGMILTAYFAVPVPPDEEAHATLAGPGGAPLWGHGSPTPEEIYDRGNRTEGDRAVYFERVHLELAAAFPDGTRPAGNWTFSVDGLHLAGDHAVRVRIEYVAGPNASTGPDFVAQDGRYLASLERTISEGNATATYPFALPESARNVTAEFSWQVPPRQFMELGDSLLFLGVRYTIEYLFPTDEEVFTHPTGIAGWVGILVTGFNLLPAGQLDGGHVARAVLGDRTKWASYGAVALMLLLSLEFAGWLVMAVLIVLLGLQHPPPLNDKSPLDRRRKVLAAVVLAVLAVTFIPFPFVPAS